jgi:exopolysaccharide biosynthesis polyprenyl glycosylphosphotransferase
MKSNVNATFIVFLIIGDFLAIMAAFTVAYIMRVIYATGPYIPITSLEYAKLFALLTPIWLGIFAVLGLYNFSIFEWRLKEFGRLIIGSFIGIMMMITYEFGINKPIFPARIIAVYAFGIACLLLILERTIIRSIRLLARSRGIGIVRTMLIGDSKYLELLLTNLKHPRRTGYEVVMVVTKEKLPSWYKGKHSSDLDATLAAIPDLGIHSIIMTSLSQDPSVSERIIAGAQENHCGFRFVPAQDSMYSGSMEVELFQGTPLIRVFHTPLFGMGRIYKRLFDIVFGTLALIITSPLIGLACLALYLFDGGDPFYRQRRLTRFNNEIRIFKVRTQKKAYHRMTPEEGFAKMGRPELAIKFREQGDFLENDPRISRIGRFLRKTSIDELPQLLNVIKGDISLVGPRPLEAFELKSYPYKHIMLSVKTGVTGLAVVTGRRDIPFDERRKLDLYYVQNWSFWLDIKILARTIVEVLRSRGS